MAGEQKYTVDIEVKGLSNLEKLNSKVDLFQTKIMSMRTAILGLGLAALGQSALAMADDLQDLSNATGIATGKLLEFKKALTVSGGQANQMAQGITTFARAIDAAAQGSLSAQNNFAELGISLNDLRTLSEQKLLDKAIAGLANIDNTSRRAALQMELFGKSFRTVDARGLKDQLDAAAGSGQRYADSIKRAAELNDAFETAAGNLKLAFLKAFEPAIKLINDFNDATARGSANMDLLIASIKIAGAALVTAFSVGIGLSIVTAIGQIGRGLGVIAGLAGGAGTAIATTFASIFAVSGKLLVPLRAIAVLFGAGLGIYAASQLFEDFGSIASNALARIVEGLGDLVAAILNLEPVSGILNAILGTQLDFSNAAGNSVKALVDKARESRQAYEELRKSQKDAQTELSKTGDVATATGDKIQRAVDTTAFDNAVKSIKKIGDSFSDINDKAATQLKLETDLIGKSKDYADLENARAALTNRTSDAVQQLRDAQANMSKDLKEAGLGKYYDEQIQRVQDLAAVEQARLNTLIPLLNKAKSAEEFRLFGIKQEYDLQDKLLAIQRDTADIGLSDIEKKYRDIARSADDSAKAAIRAEEARRGSPLSTEEVKKYYDTARKGTDALIKAQDELYKKSRLFSTGWNKAFKDYVDNAGNAADQATRMFEKFTSGIEDLFVDFAKTGKFEWKGFVASLTEELLRSQIKQTLASVLQMGNPFGGGTVNDLFGGIFGSLMGGSQATRGQSANTPLYVLDVAGGGTGGVGGMMGPQLPGGSQGGGIFSGIQKAVGAIGDGISSVFGGISDTIGGIFSGGGGGGDSGGGFLDTITSGIGSLFDGWFANGGNIGAGKFGIVGERGPELVTGPATVTPMSGSTNVTYNINAVDAPSFQALVARDPAFIYAVSMAGAQTLPQGRR